MNRFSFILGWICVCLITLALPVNAAQANAPKAVTVLGYVFPPYVNDDQSGLTRDFISFLNDSQTAWRFEYNHTSPARRYLSLERGDNDLVLFEMERWGWRNSGVPFQASKPILSGAEVYIALNEGDRTQAYFDSLPDRRLALMRGYHYGFADMNADQAWLRDNYMPWFADIAQEVIDRILLGRSDIGVVNKEFLQDFQTRNPDLASRLLVGEKLDQEYALGAIIRTGGAITSAEFDALLLELSETGALQHFFEKRGMGDKVMFNAP